MNGADKELFRKWIAKAEEDLLAVSKLLREEPVPASVVCFHCQQAAEKYLKALLALYGRPAPKIHDLEVLVDATTECGAQLEGLLTPARRLTDYAVDSRYPDAPFDFTVELAREAEQHAMAIKSAVLQVAELLLAQDESA